VENGTLRGGNRSRDTREEALQESRELGWWRRLE